MNPMFYKVVIQKRSDLKRNAKGWDTSFQSFNPSHWESRQCVGMILDPGFLLYSVGQIGRVFGADLSIVYICMNLRGSPHLRNSSDCCLYKFYCSEFFFREFLTLKDFLNKSRHSGFFLRLCAGFPLRHFLRLCVLEQT